MSDVETSIDDIYKGKEDRLQASEYSMAAVEDPNNPAREETTSLRTGYQVPNRRFKYADITNSIVLAILCAGLAILIALSAAILDKVNKQKTTVNVVNPPYVNVVYPALGNLLLTIVACASLLTV